MEITLEITNFCEFDCPFCSTNATSNGTPLSMGSIQRFLAEVLVENEIDRINISGGEPLSHPHIYEILKLCYSITDSVWVYTNMIKNIVFNTRIVKDVIEHANVCIVPGEDAYIPDKVDTIHLLKLVRQGRGKDYPDIPMVVSGNFSRSEHDCDTCDHMYLQSDGDVVSAPCKKTL